jgi:Ice-binding-like/Putative Ig domain
MTTHVRALACALIFTTLFAQPAFAQLAPTLGSSGTFGALAGSTVTNTGPTTVAGDLGVSPGAAITGFPPGTLSGGTIHAADAVAAQAQADVTTAYNALAGQTCDTDLTGMDLGGLTLTAGVYCFSTSAQLTGTLTLDAQGNPAAVFIFQIGTALTTASNSVVVVINGGSDCNAFWQVGSSATLGTGTHMVGNVLALASITLNTGASLSGRALARNGAVTMDSNALAVCGAACGIVTLGPATLPAATVGVPYAQQLVATGDVGPFTFAVTSGALPAGLSMSPSGMISGTPITPGVATFTIAASAPDVCGSVLIISVSVGPSVVSSPTSVPTLSPFGLLALIATLIVGCATMFAKRHR